MILNLIKKPVIQLKLKIEKHHAQIKTKKLINHKKAITIDDFNFSIFKKKILFFIESLQADESGVKYRYSASCSTTTLYASVYVCMTKSLLREHSKLTDRERRQWVEYFDSFQKADDGLFYDPATVNEIYLDSDWWGARHLTLHMISAYTHLNAKPKYPFYFLEQYYVDGAIESWLSKYPWDSVDIGRLDFDNKIMNIGCLLQYQRDFWNDVRADKAVTEIKKFLRDKINPQTGMWGYFDITNKHQCSRMVQFAYHLFPIFFYDNDFDFDVELILHNILKTQNCSGGYGVPINSSACEDIDSIDILIRLYPLASYKTQKKINTQLSKALPWILYNQISEGGFVFRLHEAFHYGSSETSSQPQEGAMLPTWFRTLSIAYIINFSRDYDTFLITSCPGYEF